MGRKKVIDLNAESMVEWTTKGQTLEGYYIGYKTVTTDFGPSKLHVLQTDSGTVGCWGSAQLDSKLGSVEKGVMVWITFGGKSKIAGGKTMKNFEVDYDDEDKMEVAGAVVQYNKNASAEDDGDTDTSNDADNTDSGDDQQDTGDDPDQDDDADTEPNPAAEVAPRKGTPAAPTADQKAKANALINKARAKANGGKAA